MMKKNLIAGAFCTVLLAGCWGSGGGDDDNDSSTPVTEAVPTSASESVDGFIGYLKELVVASADTLEPVDVASVTPPTADDAEPDAID